MKRIISVTLCVLLLLQAVPFGLAEQAQQVMLSPAQAAPGEELTMVVSLSGWPLMKAMYIRPEYDETVLTLESGQWLVDGMLKENWSPEYGDAVFAQGNEMDINGDVFVLTFAVQQTVAVKQLTEVKCSFMIQGSVNGEDVTDTRQIAATVAVICRHGSKEEIPAKAATCLEAGNNKYYLCSCGDVLKANGTTVTALEAETIPALGHNWTEFLQDDAHLRSKATKCTERDTYYADCIRCDTINKDAYFFGKEAGPHSFTEKIMDTDHLVPGYGGHEPVVEYYYDCAYCDAIGSEAYKVACEHTRVMQVEGWAATCVTAGSNSYLVCECGTVLKTDGVTVTTMEAETIPALGHDEIAHTAQANSCTGIGWEAYVTCSRCDYSTYVEFAPLGHYWAECIEDAAHLRSVATKCTEHDTYWNDCVRCDDISTVFYFESAQTGQHSFTEQIKDAAHLAPGYTGSEPVVEYYYDCAYCDTKGSETFFVNCTHSEKTQIAYKAATCVESGNELYFVCDCGTVLKADGVTATSVEAETIPALGHDEIPHAAQASSCTEKGWDSYVTCSRCDYSTYRELAPLGHDWTEKLEDIEHLRTGGSNCTEHHTYWYDCSRCIEHSPERYFESEQTGDHSFTEKLVDEAHRVPGAPGQYYYDCAYCDTMGTDFFADILKGDVNGDTKVNTDDAIYLLQHVLMPNQFKINQSGDFDKKGGVSVDDAIYLLQHVLMPGLFPI